MIPNDKAFNGKDCFDNNGKTIFRWYYVRNLGNYQIRLKIVSTNSIYRQGIALFFSNFKGKVIYDGKSLEIPTNKFKHYLFKDGDTHNNEFVLSVHAEVGALFIGNASERSEIGMFTCGAFGNSFWVEPLATNSQRFHCNDHEYDDDFDDMVFDLEIV